MEEPIMESRMNFQFESPKAILLSANTGPDKVDLVQANDGTIAIWMNDQETGFRWMTAEVEQGVEMYMRLLGDSSYE
jgi:hypothetical protein